jgi:molybdopterin synthase catalytic subunit
VGDKEQRVSAANPTIKERLATLEAEVKDLGEYVRNNLTHRMGRIETAVYLLVLGVAGTLLGVLLELVTR